MTDTIDLARLADPFPASEVEWRIGQSGKKRDGKVWAKVLAYVTNRAIMARLDAVCGPANWRNEYREWKGKGTLCGISVRLAGEWVTKWDGAEDTDIEEIKGGLSGAMKRAAVQWGIGRYLYDLEEGWAVVHDGGKHYARTKDGTDFHWDAPQLPPAALPAPAAPAPKPAAKGNGPPRPRAEVAAAGLAAADSLDALGVFWRSLSNADRQDPVVLAAKDKRKLELTADEIDRVCAAAGIDSHALTLLEDKLGIKGPLAMTAAEATALLDAVKAEAKHAEAHHA